MYAEGLAPKEKYNGDSFADGKAAMAIVGPWAIAVYGDKVDWGVAPVPTSGRQAGRARSTRSPTRRRSAMYSACKNQGTAWDVLKFATSKEQDGKLLDDDRPDAAAHRPRRPPIPAYFTGAPGVQGVRRPGRPHRRGAERRRTRSRSGRRSATH